VSHTTESHCPQKGSLEAKETRILLLAIQAKLVCVVVLICTSVMVRGARSDEQATTKEQLCCFYWHTHRPTARRNTFSTVTQYLTDKTLDEDATVDRRNYYLHSLES
jgi:hypothetical protein